MEQKVRKLNSYTFSSKKLTPYHFQNKAKTWQDFVRRKWRRAYLDTVGGGYNLLKSYRVADINLDYVRELTDSFGKITPPIKVDYHQFS